MPWRHIAAARRLVESEQGAIVKDWGGQIPIVLAYPNSYAVGMSSLAVHGLYRWLNALPGLVCERTFATLARYSPSTEPLLTLESQRPVREAALLAFSISFEMDYLNVISMLRRAEMPPRATERDASHPLVLLGGPAVSANPEPLRALADAIVIGEVEPILPALADCLRGFWGRAREAILDDLARLPGLYVPQRHCGGTVQRQVLCDLDAYPLASSIIAPQSEFGDMGLIEIARGCGHGCRFCLAGYWYRPPRERSLELILSQARAALQQRRKVGLVAPAVSDYTCIDELVLALRRMGAEISVSSLRIAPLSPVLVQALAAGGSRSLTLAPEAGSERLWRSINKCIAREDCLAAARLAASQPFESLKLYFMLGLPGEMDQDVEELLALVQEIAAIFPRKVVVNLTPFVPKAHTPFERAPMAPGDLLAGRLTRIKAGLRATRIEVRAEPAAAVRVQGILARGDHRVGEALLEMRRPAPAHFERALQTQGLDPEHYLRARDPHEPLPWSFIRSGVEPAYLHAESRRAHAALLTEPCAPTTCQRCGVCSPQEKR